MSSTTSLWQPSYIGLTTCVVLEGPQAGRKGSVALRNGVSRLSPAASSRESAVGMVYHRKALHLEVPGLDSFAVAWPPRNPFPAGAVFDVELPDFPHAPGRAIRKGYLRNLLVSDCRRGGAGSIFACGPGFRWVQHCNRGGAVGQALSFSNQPAS